MHISELNTALQMWCRSADELRGLDAQTGDGDLGITVSSGAQAVIAALREVDEPTDSAGLAVLLMTSARAFGNANPSTFAALTQGALMAAAKMVKTSERWDATPDSAARTGMMVAAVADSIAARGKSVPGDKTVLDALLASLTALPEIGQHRYKATADNASGKAEEEVGHEERDGVDRAVDGPAPTAADASVPLNNLLERMADAAWSNTVDLAKQPARAGRAAWAGERSVGNLDAGAVAYVRLLQALAHVTRCTADALELTDPH